MPRFFFHVFDDMESIDDEGLELADREHAIAGAVTAARELAAEEVKNGKLNLGHSIEIADEQGATLATVAFRDCIAVEG